MFSKEHNCFGGHGIVGGQIPLGAGISFADKYNNNDSVTICFMGDGAVRQGVLHETFNMAMNWRLPVVFVCENNGYAMGTSVDRTANHTEIWKLGLGYEMPCAPVEGMKPEVVSDAMDIAVNRARKGEGPGFIHVETNRVYGHFEGDAITYRTDKETEDIKDNKDPLKIFKAKVTEAGLLEVSQFDEIDQTSTNEIKQAIKESKESDFPKESDLLTDVYINY